MQRSVVLGACLPLVFAWQAPLQAGAFETISGVSAGAGVECPLFRLPDGEEISLTGTLPETDEPAALTGRWARISKCMQGRTFQVQAWAILVEKENSDDGSD